MEDGEQLLLTRKIVFPFDKYPEENFYGIIIGPRGYTKKRIEKESGARITIPHLQRDCVIITAKNLIQLERATKMIQELLHPKRDIRCPPLTIPVTGCNGINPEENLSNEIDEEYQRFLDTICETD